MTQWKYSVNNEDSNDPDDWGLFVSSASKDDYSDQTAPDELSEIMESLGWEEVAESYFEHDDFKNAIEVLATKDDFIQDSETYD